MANKPRVVLNTEEVKKLLRGEGQYHGVREDLQRRLDRIKQAAGPGHTAAVDQETNRVRGAVWTSSDTARRAESQDLSLTQALDAGRGDL